MNENTQAGKSPRCGATDSYFELAYKRAVKSIKGMVNKALERAVEKAPTEPFQPRVVIAAQILAMSECMATMVTMSDDREQILGLINEGFERGLQIGNDINGKVEDSDRAQAAMDESLALISKLIKK